MHELSLAQNLLSTVDEIGRENEISKITVIYVIIGSFAMVMEDQIRFCLDLVKKEYEFTKEAEIHISWEAGILVCKSCGYEGEAEIKNEYSYGLISVFACPKCSSHDTKIESGMETYIESIDVESE